MKARNDETKEIDFRGLQALQTPDVSASGPNLFEAQPQARTGTCRHALAHMGFTKAPHRHTATRGAHTETHPHTRLSPWQKMSKTMKGVT